MSTLSLSLDVCLGILFLREYALHVIQRGRIIDLWSVSTFTMIVVPLILVGPFADSPLNSLSIGDAVYGVTQEMDHAFAICGVGALAWYLGAVLYRLSDKRRHRGAKVMVLNQTRAVSATFSDANVGLLCAICAISGVAINAMFDAGDKTLRDYMLANAGARPLFNFFIVSLAPLTLSLVVSKYLDSRRQIFLWAGLTIASICLFSGARGIFFVPIIWLYIARQMKKPGGSLLRLAVVTLLLAVSAVGVGIWRSGVSADDFMLALGYTFLYGNTFSDFRDLCWYLSATHDTPAYSGATYLSGLMSFVPTYLSPFREQFNLGVVTATAVGLSPQEHAGIRISAFGELYINFGLLGVAFFTLLVSYIIKCFDDALRHWGPDLNYTQIVCCIYLSQIPLVVFGSNGIWSSYSFLFVIAIFRLLNFCFPARSTRLKRREKLRRSGLTGNADA